MSGGTQQATQSGSTTVTPWKGVDKLINRGVEGIGELYESGQMGGYTGPTMTPFSRQSMDSFQGMGWLNRIAQPGLNDAYRKTAYGANAHNKDIQHGFGKSFDVARQMAQNPLSGEQKQARNFYQDLASGGQLDAENPYLDDVIQRGQDSALKRINAQASGMGRYGSGVHQGNIARELGGIETNARYQNYDRERGRMDSANAALANLGQQGFQNQSAAMGALSGLSQQGLTNQMNNRQLLPGFYEAMMAPMDRQRAIGQEFENLNQGMINDQIRRYDMPYNNLMKLSSLLGMAAPYSSTQTTGVTTQPGPSPFMQGLGTIGSIGSLIGGF